jgi:hypothetical protein
MIKRQPDVTLIGTKCFLLCELCGALDVLHLPYKFVHPCTDWLPAVHGWLLYIAVCGSTSLCIISISENEMIRWQRVERAKRFPEIELHN